MERQLAQGGWQVKSLFMGVVERVLGERGRIQVPQGQVGAGVQAAGQGRVTFMSV